MALLIGGRHRVLGEDEVVVRAGEDRPDAPGREVRLDRQIHTARLEDAQHGGQPVEVALHEHGDDALGPQPVLQQGPADAVGPGVEFAVRPLPVAFPFHGGHRVGVGRRPLLEQLVHPPVRQYASRTSQLLQLEVEFGLGQQAPPYRCGEGGQVVAGDPGGGLAVEDVGAVAQAQSAAGGGDVEHAVVAVGTEGGEHPVVCGPDGPCVDRQTVRQRDLVHRRAGPRVEGPVRDRVHGLTSPPRDFRPSAPATALPRPSSGRSRGRARRRRPSRRRSGRVRRCRACSRRRS